MKKLLKPACLLLYLLSLLSFFIIGLWFAGWLEAGKNQGLAGGAIVLGYGLIFGFIGLVLSFFAAYYLKQPLLIKANIILSILLTAGILSIVFNVKERSSSTDVEYDTEEELKPAAPSEKNELLATANYLKNNSIGNQMPIGLGFFKPNLSDGPVLRFYGQNRVEQMISLKTAVDSIVFVGNQISGIEIKQAPPWLAPEHLKLDYDILLFKVVSVTDTTVGVIGNKYTGQTYLLARESGELLYWPDFLLTVFAVEFLPGVPQKVKLKPLESAGTVNGVFAFMKPVRIDSNWMQVELWDDSLEKKGYGWMQWKKGDSLLISYSLLS